jgi:hypothetical protein
MEYDEFRQSYMLKSRSCRYVFALLLLASAPFVASCDLLKLLQPPTIEIELNKVFQLALEQTALLPSESLWITFNQVLEDSRCPQYVQCIWAGNAKVAIEVMRPGSGKETLILNSTLEPHEALYQGFRIHFEGLAPPSRIDQRSSSQPYLLSLSVTKRV